MRRDDVLWLGLTCWYMAVLALCATAAPGEGLFGALLAAIPPTVHTWLYVPTAGLLAWLLLHSFESRRWSPRVGLIASAVASLTFAFVLEWTQAWLGNRALDLTHVVWAATGILLTWMLWVLGARNAGRTVQPADVVPLRLVPGRTRKGSLR